MRITTWNINSLRLRLDQVLRLLDVVAPDVLCLQEIKAEDHQVPVAALADAGYSHVALRGFKGYNGVATFSRHPLTPAPHHDWCGRADGRHVAASLADGLEIHNFYVPAGGDEPDPKINEKFAHKLAFLDEMETNFRAIRRQKKAKRQILVGDLNIAPGEHDVWSSKLLKNVVSHTAVEIAALARVQASLNWEDVSRHFVPASEKLYSWWLSLIHI